MARGLILIWKGSIASIPDGWFLCDGNNDTLDLTDKFIVNAGDIYSKGDIGGSATHILSENELPSHTHNYFKHVSLGYSVGGGNAQTGVTDGNTSSVGGDQAHNNLPPYYSLAYINKPYDGLREKTIEKGIISIWEGVVGDIPSGWVFCDGTNGTPSMKDSFIVSAGDTYSFGDVGGEDTVTLTIDQIPNHVHTYEQNISLGASGSGGTTQEDVVVTPSQATGGDQPHENRPPYYSLPYIMRR